MTDLLLTYPVERSPLKIYCFGYGNGPKIQLFQSSISCKVDKYAVV